MKRFIKILFFIIYSVSVQSQTLEMFDIDKSEFPIIKAKFFNYDNNLSKINNTSISDYKIIENSIQRKILNIKCDNNDIIKPISSVLVFDVSSSMIEDYKLNRLQITKNAGKLWIDKLPENNFECAITTFSQFSTLLTDFTDDKDLLKNKIDNNFYTGGGTYYNPAFLNLSSGGIHIAKNGKYRRIIIFLTDGSPSDNPNYNQIISLANNYKISIFCLVIGMNTPNGLKRICDNTGGKCFDNIENQEQLNAAYLHILNSTTIITNPCEIEWESDLFCEDESNIFCTLKYIPNNQSHTGMYKIDSTEKLKVTIEPRNIDFSGESVGRKFQKKIKIISNQSDIIIDEISSTNKEISITPTYLSLKKGIAQTITISYVANNTSFNKYYIYIKSQNCNYNINFYGKASDNKIIIEDDSAYVGEQGLIKIKTILKSNNPRKYKFIVSYNKSLLTVTEPNTNISYNDSNEICEYYGEWNGQDSMLKQLTYTAGLGNAESTEIKMLEFRWLDNNTTIEARNAHFYLLGICYEGGTRLVSPRPIDFYLLSNYSKNIISLHYKSNLEISFLKVYDFLGNEVFKSLLPKSINYKELNVDVQGNNSGVYLIVLQAGGYIISRKYLLIK